MRYISIFSGVEAASVAWGPLGWEPVAFAEIEPFPCAVLKERYPGVPNLGDVSEVDWSPYAGTVDLIVGGSPCQSFSVAGKREGLDGASGLMWEFCRAVADVGPRWFVWENVPGALSSSNGEDFGCLLRFMDEHGYGMAWRVLDAQFFGVAQRRRRVFLVGHSGERGGALAGAVLLEQESVRGNTQTSREKRKELAGDAGSRTEECCSFVGRCGSNHITGRGGYGVLKQDNVASTLNTCFHQTVVHEGCLTPWDSQTARIYGEDGTWPTLSGCSDVSGLNRQSVLCSIDGDIARGAYMGKNDKGYNEDGVASTLSTSAHQTVVHEGCLTPWDCQSKRVFDPKTATAPSLQAGSGGGAQCPTVCYAIQGSMIGRSESAGSQGDSINDDLSFTLNTADRHAVCFQQNTRDEVRYINGDGSIAGALAANAGAKQQNYIVEGTDYEDDLRG